MNRKEIKIIAKTIEEIICKENEYGNSAIDEKAPKFLQVARNGQNREETVDFIASALEEKVEACVEIYHYLEILEGYVRDARCENDTSELAEYAALIDKAIREIEIVAAETTPNFDLVLLEKEEESGLVLSEIEALMSLFGEKHHELEVYPIELPGYNSSAMGFITASGADKIDYDYNRSGLVSYIASILKDMNRETENGVYEFKGLKIWLKR